METYSTGGAETFTVAVDTDGQVSYEDPDATQASGSVSSGSPSACSDGAYVDKDEEQAGRWNWWLGDGTRPAGLTTAQTRDALQQALDWLSVGHTDCDISAGYSAYAVANYYQGVSTYESDMHLNDNGVTLCGDGSFDGRDHESVVDFGDLNTGYSNRLAVECTWLNRQPFNKDNIVESDIRFNTTDHDFYYTKPSSCSGRWDLRGVAIHEFGHTYGLAHVVEDSHGNLTMSTDLYPCDNSQRTLGKGDILALRKIYG